MTNRILYPSPLAHGDVRLSDAARVALLERDANVLIWASRAHEAMERLTQEAGRHGLMSEAMARAAADHELRTVTPEAVVKQLEQIHAEILAELDRTRPEFKAHAEQVRKGVLGMTPLVNAVSRLLCGYVEERSRLRAARDALRRHGLAVAGVDTSDRYTKLSLAGLSEEEILKLGVATPTQAETAKHARLVELDELIKPLEAFNADPCRDPAHLAGVSELADLIQKQQIAFEGGGVTASVAVPASSPAERGA